MTPGPPAAARTIATEIAIACGIERAWAVLTDFASYARWNPYLVRIDGAAHAGTTIVVHARRVADVAPVAQSIDVIAASPYCMRWQGGAADRAEFAGDHWFELAPNGPHCTQFKHYEHFTGTRLAAFGPRHEAAVRDDFRRFNEALKLRCEGLAGRARGQH